MSSQEKVSKSFLIRNLKRRLYNFRKLILFTIVLIVSICLFFFLKSVGFRVPFLEIKNVKIVGTKRFLSEKDVETIAKQNSLNSNILTFDNQKLEKTLKEVFLAIKELKVVKKYPDSIEVQIREREPLAIIHKNDTDFFLIDSEGYILGQVAREEAGLPAIRYAGASDLVIGTFVEKDLVGRYLILISSLNETSIKYDDIFMSENKIEFKVNSSIQVFMSPKKSVASSINLLKELLTKYNNENIALKRVDLRFDKVIVEY